MVNVGSSPHPWGAQGLAVPAAFLTGMSLILILHQYTHHGQSVYIPMHLSHSACFDEIIHLFSSPCLSLAVAPSIYICLYNVYILFSCCQCFIFPLPKQDKSLLKTVFRFSFREFSRKLHSIIRLVFFCPRCVEHVLHSRTFLLYIHFVFE